MSYEPNEPLVKETAHLFPDRRYYYVLLTLFVVSGCSALIYEVVWFQMLQLVIGLSALSLSVLLGSYMGGMFLGSLFLTRLIPMRTHPLRVYALLELGIGIIGLLLLFGMPYIDRLYITSVGHGFPGILLRCVVCTLILLPPTLLMGATLPIIARWVERTPKGVSWLGFLYSGNLAGALCGCLLAGFYLLRVFDVTVATYVAVSINFGVAAISMLLALKTPYSISAPAPAESRHVREPGYQMVYLVTALSGLCALGAEVVWTRLLSLVLDSTVYAFAFILAIFLAGLGIGSSAGSFLVRKIGYPRALLALCQLLLTGAIAWAAFAITHVFSYWMLASATLPASLLRSLLAILPAAALWGASFPLALASVASRDQEPGHLVGEVYASNTLGAIAGAIGFSLLVVPRLGTQHAQQLMAGLSGISALVMIAMCVQHPDTHNQPRKLFGVPLFRLASFLTALGVTALFCWSIPVTPWSMTAYGRRFSTLSKYIVPGITPEENIPAGDGMPYIYSTFFQEGMSESVVVTNMSDGTRHFHVAGKTQASNRPEDMRLQRMLGHISALTTVDKPRSVLVVACGAGVTAGTYTLYPSIQRIVICDLEKLVPKFVAPLFKTENYGVVNDPRTEVIVDDGRHFVRTTQEKFDIITSDPVDPFIKGAAALYTEEYFAQCRNHLNPGGTMALWIPFYECSPAAVKSLFGAFFKVFPEGIIWSNEKSGKGYDAVLFGQAGPAHIDVDKVQALLDSPGYLKVAHSLGEVGFPRAIDLFSTFAGYGPFLQTWLSNAQVNTDLNLRLQYLTGMSVGRNLHAQVLDEIFRFYSFPENVFRGSEKSILELKMRTARRN